MGHAQQVSRCEIAPPPVGGQRRFRFGGGTGRTVRTRRRPARRVIDNDRAAVATPVPGEGAQGPLNVSTSEP
jgi:hypothetical protein